MSQVVIPNDANSGPSSGKPGERRDNVKNGELIFLGGKTFIFDDDHRAEHGNTDHGRMVMEFADDCFSANFIVAMHPRQGEVEEYRFDAATRQALLYKDFDGNWKKLGASGNAKLCTLIMTVLSWQGFDFTTAKDKWVFDKTNYRMRTPLPTIDATKSQNTEQSAPTPLSILEYADAFHMTVDFDFAGVGASYVNAYSSPTQEHSKNPHRSFHRNSGVKIYGLFEMQIYDTAALLAESNLSTIVKTVTGAPVANWQSGQSASSGIKKNGDTAYESISGCVTNIPYQSKRWHIATNAELSEVSSRTRLDFSFIPNGDNTFQIITQGDPSSNIDTGVNYNELIYGTGGSHGTRLFDQNNQSADKKLHLQTHWGSGVLFKKITITEL